MFTAIFIRVQYLENTQVRGCQRVMVDTVAQR